MEDEAPKKLTTYVTYMYDGRNGLGIGSAWSTPINTRHDMEEFTRTTIDEHGYTNVIVLTWKEMGE